MVYIINTKFVTYLITLFQRERHKNRRHVEFQSHGHFPDPQVLRLWQR